MTRNGVLLTIYLKLKNSGTCHIKIGQESGLCGSLGSYDNFFCSIYLFYVEPYEESLNGHKLWCTGNNIIRYHLLCSRDCHAEKRSCFRNCFQPFDDDYRSHHGCFHPCRKNISRRVSTKSSYSFTSYKFLGTKKETSLSRGFVSQLISFDNRVTLFYHKLKVCVLIYIKVESSQFQEAQL